MKACSPAFQIAKNVVEIWSVNVASGEQSQLRYFESVLNADERKRARKLVFLRDRHQFVLARYALRKVLSGYLQCPFGELAFAAGPYGKPRLIRPEQPWLRFNLSHSGQWALIACACDRELGIDIERTDQVVEADSIVAGFFADGEKHYWNSLAPEVRQRSFYDLWVRKEAYVKALGLGMAHPTRAYSIKIRPDGGTVLELDSLRPGTESDWELHELRVAMGYVAALAVTANRAPVIIRQRAFAFECRQELHA